MQRVFSNSGFYLSQAFDVLTNNLCKQSFLFVLAYFSASQQSSLLMANLAITVYIVPFLFLSYFAGQHAEPRNKRTLIRILKSVDFLLLGLVTLSYASALPELTLLMIFLLGCKTAYMTPVKFAYMSEKYQGNALLRSNGLMQTLSLTCMLVAITSAGFVIELVHTPVNFGFLLLSLSAVGLLSAACMQNSQPLTQQEPQQISSVRELANRVYRAKLTTPMLAIAWFWFISALFVSQFINFVKMELNGEALAAATALAIFVLGMLSGMALLECFKRHAQHLLFPSALALSALTAGIALYESPGEMGITHLDLFRQAAGLSGLLFATGMCATTYVAPLYTQLQGQAPAHLVARIMGLSSFLNAVFIVASTAFAYLTLSLFALSLTQYFVAISLSNTFFFCVIILLRRRMH